jgi:hypothetical protein
MLRGSLDDFSLEDILWLVARAENTGELVVNRPGGSGRVFFRDGSVAHAETGLLRGTARQLESDPRLLLEESAFELLRRDGGDFSWNTGEEAPEGASLSLGVEDLLATADDRWSELDIIHGIIPSEKSVLTIASSPPENVREITVTRSQWSLLAYLDGRRSVEAVAREADMGEFHVLRTLYPIAERGLLEVDASTPANAGSSDAQIDLTDSGQTVNLVRVVNEGN